MRESWEIGGPALNTQVKGEHFRNLLWPTSLCCILIARSFCCISTLRYGVSCGFTIHVSLSDLQLRNMYSPIKFALRNLHNFVWQMDSFWEDKELPMKGLPLDHDAPSLSCTDKSTPVWLLPAPSYTVNTLLRLTVCPSLTSETFPSPGLEHLFHDYTQVMVIINNSIIIKISTPRKSLPDNTLSYLS